MIARIRQLPITPLVPRSRRLSIEYILMSIHDSVGFTSRLSRQSRAKDFRAANLGPNLLVIRFIQTARHVQYVTPLR